MLKTLIFIFSIGMFFYVLLGIHFEEKSLAQLIGVTYQQYQGKTAKVIPKSY